MKSTFEVPLFPSQKTKTLFGRWMAQKNSTAPLERPSDQSTSVKESIGMNSIVTCKFKFDRWKDSPKIANGYRVLTVYEKFYNKWWMSCEKKLWSPTMDTNAKKKFQWQSEW